MKRVLIIIAAALAAVLLIYGVVWLAMGWVVYPQFYSGVRQVHRLPDLWGGFIPQGTTYQNGTYYVCGYMTGDENSRLYVYSGDSVKKIILLREDGSDYGGHAGGVTAAGDFIYISNASKLFVLKRAEVDAAGDGDTVKFMGHIEVPCRASFCSSDGKNVYVGEYHAEGYETEDSHIVAASDGEKYAALVFAYALDSAQPLGIAAQPVPSAVYAVCDKVQGFAVDDKNRAVLSCSSGLEPSLLRTYDLAGKADSEFEGAPLYILDSKRAVSTLKIPHMSEDLEFRDGKLMFSFEAGAKKFGGGILPCSVCSLSELEDYISR